MIKIRRQRCGTAFDMAPSTLTVMLSLPVETFMAPLFVKVPVPLLAKTRLALGLKDTGTNCDVAAITGGTANARETRIVAELDRLGAHQAGLSTGKVECAAGIVYANAAAGSGRLQEDCAWAGAWTLLPARLLKVRASALKLTLPLAELIMLLAPALATVTAKGCSGAERDGSAGSDAGLRPHCTGRYSVHVE